MRHPNLKSRWSIGLVVLLGSLTLALLPGPGAALAPAPPRKPDAEVEEAVAAGLKWLALHQAQDGRWSFQECNQHAREHPLPQGKTFTCNCTGLGIHKDDVAATSFALLPFLAAGITQKAGEQNPDYSRTVLGGLEFLQSKQAKDGSFASAMYSHALATLAVCNAYRVSADPKFKPSAQKALNFIVSAQDPKGGGWRYAPQQAGDLSATSWQMQALQAGRLAGLHVPGESFRNAEAFVDSCEVKNQGKTEGYSYVPSAIATDSMTAAAVLNKMYLGTNPRNRTLLAGIERLKQRPPHASKNYYYLHYATQAMHHFGGKGGEAWDLWWKGQEGRKGLRELLLEDQDQGRDREHDHQKGSWEANEQGHVRVGGRIMATSLILQMLLTPRQTPLYRRDLGIEEENP